jgi:NADPH2:quinone reductase
MQVIEISSFGAPEVLRLAERATPVAASGEVLIRVVASGINRPDVLQRLGHYPAPPRRFRYSGAGSGRSH